MHDKFDSEEFTIMNGFGLSLTFFRQIYNDVNINCISTKILFILSTLSTYLIYIHYTAYLTAVSTYGKENSINSFWDVLSGGYQVFVFENWFCHGLLRHARPGTGMHEVYHKTMKDRPSAFIHSLDDFNNALPSMKTSKKLFFSGDLFLKTLKGQQDEGLRYLRIQGSVFHKIYFTFCILYTYVIQLQVNSYSLY